MELFPSVRKCYQTLGVYPRGQSNRNLLQLNWRNYFILMCHLKLVAISLAYTIAKAKVIGEFADSILLGLNVLSALSYALSSIYKISQTLELIREFENFIEKSKLKLILSPICV